MKCESCGKETDGTWSEGGALWHLCEDCFEKEMGQIYMNDDSCKE